MEKNMKKNKTKQAILAYTALALSTIFLYGVFCLAGMSHKEENKTAGYFVMVSAEEVHRADSILKNKINVYTLWTYDRLPKPGEDVFIVYNNHRFGVVKTVSEIDKESNFSCPARILDVFKAILIDEPK